MDGTYRSTLQYRLDKADCIIYLDYSTISQLKGVLQRFFTNYGKGKNEIAGCKEKINFKFLLFVLKWRKNKRKDILDKLKNINNNNIYIFKSRRQLNKWYMQK